MSDLLTIVSGWYHFVQGDAATKERMKKRLKFCNTCEYRKDLNTTGKTLVNLISNNPTVSKCTACSGCPLSAKTAAPDSECPKGLWSKEHTVKSYY